MLLTLAGETAIEIYNTFTFTESEIDKSDKIEPLIHKFEACCTPKKNLTYERHVFHSRKQHADETFDHFLTDLKIIIRKCSYGQLADDLLRDQIVEGIQSNKVRARLLRESELDLQKCIDICRADEAATARMKSLSNTCDLNNVDQVNTVVVAEIREAPQAAVWTNRNLKPRNDTPHLLVAGVVINMDQDPARRMAEFVITAADLIIFRKCVEVKNLSPKWKLTDEQQQTSVMSQSKDIQRRNSRQTCPHFFNAHARPSGSKTGILSAEIKIDLHFLHEFCK